MRARRAWLGWAVCPSMAPGKRGASNGGNGAVPPASKASKLTKDLSDEVAMLRAQVTDSEARIKQLEALALEFRARAEVSGEVIAALQVRNNALEESSKAREQALQELQATCDRLMAEAAAGPTPPGAAASRSNTEAVQQQLERSQRDSNQYKVILFTKGQAADAQIIRAKFVGIFGLASKDMLQVFPAKTVWIIRFATAQLARDVLRAWYTLFRATGWGLDQALTRQQLRERALLRPQFQELKQAGAHPIWRGSELYVRTRFGVRPAAQWSPEAALPPRRSHAAGPGAAAPPAAGRPQAPSTAAAATAAAASTAATGAAAPAAGGPVYPGPPGSARDAPGGSGVDPLAADYDPLPPRRPSGRGAGPKEKAA